MLNTDEIRIVEVIAPDYEGFGPGGLLEDLKLGFSTVWPHHAAFKRIAVVSDKPWVAPTLHALAWVIPGELKSSSSTSSTKLKIGPPASSQSPSTVATRDRIDTASLQYPKRQTAGSLQLDDEQREAEQAERAECDRHRAVPTADDPRSL